MPYKHNADRRHHIAKMNFRVTNWPEYEAGLRRRGSLTLWMTPEALARWHAPRRKTRGGQPRYSDLAIETALTLGCVFGMRLRQTEGLMNSVFDLMGLEIPVPDHTTLSRRAQTWKLPAQRNPPLPDGPLHVLVDSTGLKVYGAGQWLEEKHGARSRRNWRKFHLAVDANSGEIIAHRLTDQGTDDPSQVEPLLSQIDGEIDQFTADGAYDGKPTYQTVLQHSATANVVIPPRSTAVESNGDTGPPDQRDKHIAAIAKDGRLQWQAATGYGKRARIETAIGRYKGLIGRRVRARSFATQQTEVAIACIVLNRMLACGRPESVRRQVRQA
ncbi:IS5 family transposase [Rhizobium leguminosarum]|uniref:IS5 family transposase n=1 Tax=Rhizobium leguminosarum TaxID=384 RepID=UPI00143F9C2D|nr:IS5 family transposase [Rhizobium leguminosarum]NKL25023.1 IS5 family transposase [Rhizobium leguminosarum bv. viciae]